MLLYLYRPEGSSALDFSVRRVADDDEWPFEVCDVQEGGVAFGAGLRAGDRISGFSDYSLSGHKKARNWGDDTLQELGARASGSLFILFVDKRVALGPEEEVLMKKRLDFIAARKSNLKRFNRLDELSKFVQKWDKRNAKISGLTLVGSQSEASPSSQLPTIRVCVYDIDFTVQKVDESAFEVAGVERTSVAYRSGIRNGDALCGFNHFDEDGRMKAHEWHDGTLNEIKARQLVFVLVGKKNPLQEAERRYWLQREKYVSQIKSKLGEAIQLGRFLERVQSWDYKHSPPDPGLAEEQQLSSRPYNVDPEAAAGPVDSEDQNGETVSKHVDTRGGNNQVNEPRMEKLDNNDALGRFAALAECGSNTERADDTVNEASSEQIGHEKWCANDAVIHASKHTGTASRRSDSFAAAEDCSIPHEKISTQQLEAPTKLSIKLASTTNRGEHRDKYAGCRQLVDIAEPLDGLCSSTKRVCDSPPTETSSLQKRLKSTKGAEKTITHARIKEQDKQDTVLRFTFTWGTGHTFTKSTELKNDLKPSPTPMAPNSSSSSVTHQGFAALNEEQDAHAAARKFLLAVSRKPILKRLSKFPCWERRLLEVLGKHVATATTAQLGVTLTLLRDATSKRQSNHLLLDEYVEWIIQTIKFLPDTEHNDRSQEATSEKFIDHKDAVQQKLGSAVDAGTGLKSTVAWLAVIDSIILALGSYVKFASKLHRHASEWRTWCESTSDKLRNHHDEIMTRKQDWRLQMDQQESIRHSQEKKMEVLQKSLDSELQRTEESFSQQHCELAAAKNYAGCSELRNAYQKQLSSDPQIASLRRELTRCYKDVRTNNKTAAEAKDTLAFWEGLLKLCELVQEQLDAHILDASTKMKKLATPFDNYSLEDLQWIGSKLTEALENYFDRSFQTQEAALDCIDKMRQIQVEHDKKFGGFISFDVAGITQYQRVVDEAQLNDNAVVTNLSLLWEDVQFYLPGVQHYFAFGELDRKLAQKYMKPWGKIKQAVQEAIDTMEKKKSTNIGLRIMSTPLSSGVNADSKVESVHKNSKTCEMEVHLKDERKDHEGDGYTGKAQSSTRTHSGPLAADPVNFRSERFETMALDAEGSGSHNSCLLM